MLNFAIDYRTAIDTVTSNRDLNLRKYKLADEEWGQIDVCTAALVSIPANFLILQRCTTMSINTCISIAKFLSQFWGPSHACVSVPLGL